MTLDLITKKDLKEFKNDILNQMASMLSGKTEQKKWLKSVDVRKMLSISPGTLQNLRVNGTLPYTKLGKTIYYEYKDVIAILEKNKKTA